MRSESLAQRSKVASVCLRLSIRYGRLRAAALLGVSVEEFEALIAGNADPTQELVERITHFQDVLVGR